MILPRGYARLRKDLGDILLAGRRRLRLKQGALAQDLGVSRETLSRIENGRVPRPRVLDELMPILDLDWRDIAIEGRVANSRPFVEGWRGDQLSKIGGAIRSKRIREGKSLRVLAAELHLSASTLSRLERGHAVMSRVFTEPATHWGIKKEDRPVVVTHPALAAYLYS